MSTWCSVPQCLLAWHHSGKHGRQALTARAYCRRVMCLKNLLEWEGLQIGRQTPCRISCHASRNPWDSSESYSTAIGWLRSLRPPQTSPYEGGLEPGRRGGTAATSERGGLVFFALVHLRVVFVAGALGVKHGGGAFVATWRSSRETL